VTLASQQPYGAGGNDLGARGGGGPANLGDILERVLDKGLVIAGDIRVNLLDIELLTIKLRLVIASLETAKEVGIDWWEHDPWLRGDRDLEGENRRLRERVAALEHAQSDDRSELERGRRPELSASSAQGEADDERSEPAGEEERPAPRARRKATGGDRDG
jgi:hypothetical protein